MLIDEGEAYSLTVALQWIVIFQLGNFDLSWTIRNTILMMSLTSATYYHTIDIMSSF